MSTALALIFAGLCLLAIAWRLLRLSKALNLLASSIKARQPFLSEDTDSTGTSSWEELCRNTNELISENNRLLQQRTGQLAQLEATLGSLQEAVLIVDAGNYVVLANRALQSIFPKAENIVKQRVELGLHSKDFINFIESVRSGKAQPQSEIEFIDGNRSVWVEATGALIPAAEAGNASWALFVLHDITRQKQLENVRKDFVANVSHELRTPLSVIKGYIETLSDNHRDMPDEEREKFIRTAQKHAERLHSLLEDLLTLSRLESKNPGLHKEVLHPGVFVASYVEEFRERPAAREHKIETHIDTVLPEALIDPLKFSQVLENLLENAIKYAPKGSLITVSVKRRNGDIELCVADNGPGIPAADLPHLFERFYRVEKGRSREKGGTGLGLSIVKHIALLHAGKAWVESEQGRGSAFFVTFPCKAS